MYEAGSRKAVVVDRPRRGELPLVFDSPHSGTCYPDDFGHSTALETLRASEDRFVDDLFADAPAAGATLVRALFARSYIDPNRSRLDIDLGLLSDDWPEAVDPGVHSERGFGLIFSRAGDASLIYDRKLTAREVRHRIEEYWRPYHEALEGALDRLHTEFGAVWHVNCHSMQPVGNALAPDPGRHRPDFVIGDLDGESCEPSFTEFVAASLRDLGYSVSINDPYRGAYIIERYGRPNEAQHALQIEVNRALYMNQSDLERHEGFTRLQRDLTAFAQHLAGHVGECLSGERYNRTAQKKSKARSLAS